MQRTFICTALMAVSLGWWLSAMAVAQAARGSNSDQQFLLHAASSGMAEVQLGQLATERAASAEVKQFGQRMVDDHTKANQELRTLAQARVLPAAIAIDPKHKAIANKLATLHGAAFDREYMAGQVADHEEAVALFSTAAKESQNAQVKAWAAKTLPTLQEHLLIARALAAKQKR
jgi:putative membrane protein